ncbi:hypothetical protein SD10_02355 [Spirosoma radiotolerans]|uniref:Outer membrane protein beta-barrel domain-containing protein n=2 Tax=Spirosoma radiotolerans TaxID=1379870 RepID=A0A0E3ZTM5_9BACT|nr:hypothetical protein SD10_02355 [Spirosoma radiotolerans]
MKSFTCVALFLLISFESYAQHTITGTVINENGHPFEFINVSLFRSGDTLPTQITQSTVEGIYQFRKITPGTYSIKTSFVGYDSALSNVFSVSDSNVTVAAIQVRPGTKSLAEVTITGTRLFLQQSVDKLVINVQNSPLSSGATALEVLQRVPGLQVTNDKVLMAGKTSVSILIDGRSSQYTDIGSVIRELPSSSIDRIEVITNPGASYDAQGGGLINIILKHNSLAGTNGTISLSGGYGRFNHSEVNAGIRNYYRYTPSVSLNHRRGAFNVFGSYSYLHRDIFEINLIKRYLKDTFYDQKNFNPSSYGYHSYRVGVDYYLDSTNTLGFLITGFNRSGNGNFENTSTNYSQSSGKVVESLTSRNNQSNINNTYEINLNWKHQFKRPGKALNIDLNNAHYLFDNESTIGVVSRNNGTYTNYQKARNSIRFQNLKVDYTSPLNRFAKVEAGAKSSFARITNDLRFRQDEQPDPGRSNRFVYTENINALYVNFIAKLRRWDFQAGIRAEQTISNGKTGDSVLVNRHYIKPFVTLLATRRLDSNLAITFQYSRRIDRPTYQQQNPFEFYIDPQTYIKGNPTLLPQLTHSGKLSLTYQNLPFFSINYDRTTNVIFQYAPQQRTVTEANGATRLISYTIADNIAQADAFSAQLNFPITFRKLVSGYGGGMLTRQHYRAIYQGDLFDRSKWAYTFYTEINFKLNNTLSSQLSGYYAGPSQFEFISAGRNSSVNIAVEQKILNNKGKIVLAGNDLFHDNRTIGLIRFQDINFAINQYSSTRNFRLTFSYLFGNQSIKGERKRKTGSEEETSRVKLTN